jgi:hypothetical protein
MTDLLIAACLFLVVVVGILGLYVGDLRLSRDNWRESSRFNYEYRVALQERHRQALLVIAAAQVWRDHGNDGALELVRALKQWEDKEGAQQE